MPLNIPGLLAPLQLIFYPRLVLPQLSVKDIRHIDFVALRKAGYRGAVFDKDNCLTLPHRDTLVPELTEAWKECREAFGDGNVLIVSNSTGTYLDAGGIQSESVTHHLRVPVLLHQSFKPAYSCISTICKYFSSLRSPIQEEELVVVGDRVFTDVIMANRMRKGKLIKSQSLSGTNMSSANEKISDADRAVLDNIKPMGPLAIWTTGVWEKESMFMRFLERRLVASVERWSRPPIGEPFNVAQFVRDVPKPETPKRSWYRRVFEHLKRT